MDDQGRLYTPTRPAGVDIYDRAGCAPTRRVTVPEEFAYPSWDAGRGLFWVAGRAVVSTWDPATNQLVPRFTSTVPDGTPVLGLAYQASTDTVWVTHWASSGVNLLAYAPEGTLRAASREPYTMLTAIGSDGLHLWFDGSNATASAIQRHPFPVPGQPLPAHDFRTRAGYSVDDLEFDAVTFAPRCAVWTSYVTWGTWGLDAWEVPCLGEAIGDAWVAGSRGALDLYEHGRATTKDGREQNRSAELLTPAGRVAAGRAEAFADPGDAKAPQPLGEAVASVPGFELPGLLRFDALEVRTRSTVAEGVASSRGEAFLRGLRVGEAPPVDHRYEGRPVHLDLPHGAGRVTLFASEERGDGTRWTDLRLTGVRIALTGSPPPLPSAPGVEAQSLELGVAWSGAALGTLPKHPAPRPPLDCKDVPDQVLCTVEAQLRRSLP